MEKSSFKTIKLLPNRGVWLALLKKSSIDFLIKEFMRYQGNLLTVLLTPGEGLIAFIQLL